MLLRIGAQALLACLVLAAPAAGSGVGGTAPAPERRSFTAGELLVGFKDGVPAAAQRRVLARHGAAVKWRFARIDGVLASTPAAKLRETLKALERDPRVEYAEPNFLLHVDQTPDDPAFGQLWGLQKIGAPQAWDVTTGSAGVVVGVIDSGVDFGHPDLSDAMWLNPGENCAGCRSNGADDDGNGYVDDWRGWDFVGNDNNPFDDNGHGTHVAGTIAATGNNGVGITGVSWSTQIMGLKFIGANGSGTAADAVRAILYASAKGAQVTNNSYGGDGYSEAMLDAIRAADASGSLFVAAAGNSFTDTDEDPNYPSSYDVPNVVSVAASDAADRKSWFSNYGKSSVDLSAPGEDVYSTWPGGGYRFEDGTSMAAPHVAGAAAVVQSAFPGASAVGSKALLLRTVDPVAGLAPYVGTGGRLNVDRAVRCAAAPNVWVDAPAPGFEVPVGEPVPVRVLAARCAEPRVAASVSVNGAPVELTARGDGLFTGSFTPTAGGTLTVNASAETDTQVVSGMAIRNYAIMPGGAPVMVTTTTPGENATLTFDGVAGQRVALKLSGVTIGSSSCCSAKVSMSDVVAPRLFGRNGLFVDTVVLPRTGTYTVLVDPQGSDVGSATLTLYDVPADATTSIAPGGAPVSVSVGPVPGQNARVSFTGLAGQRVSLKVSGVTIGTSTCCSAKVSIIGLTTPALVGTNGLFVDTKALPANGVYTILVDPQGTEVGNATLTLFDVPADATGSIAAGGAPVSVSTSVPGQNAVLSFSGSAGQRVAVKAAGVTVGSSPCCSLWLSVRKPDGSTVGLASMLGRNGGFVDTRTLPVSGMYSVLVDPQGMDVGGVTLTMYDVPPDVTASISPGGAPVTVSMGPVPGQNAQVSFTGVAGQRVSLKLSGVTIGSSTCCSAQVLAARLFGATFVGTNGGFVDTKVLPATGVYTIVVDPQGMDLGNATLTLHDVPADVGGSLSVGGPPISVSVAVPGQNASLSFSGSAGQRVTVRASGVTIGPSPCCSMWLAVRKADGSSLAQALVGTNGGAVSATLPADGSYSVFADPQGAATGGLTLALT